MRLDIKAFRLIKPIGAIDFYEAGGPITNKSFVQISEIYQKNIKVLLEEKGPPITSASPKSSSTFYVAS